MADVFISYAREDAARAGQVARAIEALGFEVFWDTEVPPGQTWADYIESKLSQCKVMLVLWSEVSTKSQWVREEARMARDRGVLIPVMLDNSAPPFGFGEVQTANLASWRGETDNPDWRRLESAVRAAAGAPSRPARPTPPPPPPQFFSTAPGAGQQAGAGAAVSPVDYVRKCLSLYVNGHGRARRAEYWWFILFEFVVLVAAVIVDAVWNSAIDADQPILLFTGLVALAVLLPGVCVTIRRFHDVGMSGWFVLLGLVPYLGGLFVLVVALIPGQAQDNKFGPNPKAG